MIRSTDYAWNLPVRSLLVALSRGVSEGYCMGENIEGGIVSDVDESRG